MENKIGQYNKFYMTKNKFTDRFKSICYLLHSFSLKNLWKLFFFNYALSNRRVLDELIAVK